MLKHDVETKGRLVAKLTRELLQRESFDGLPDLTEALKCRCARLRIRPSNDDINDAYRLIESNTPLREPRCLHARPRSHSDPRRRNVHDDVETEIGG